MSDILDEEQPPAAKQAALSHLLGGVRSAARLALGVVYPPTCIACGAATGEAHTLCATCWSEVRFIERPFCERLGTPFAVDLGIALLSPAAIADPPVFRRARGSPATTRSRARSCTDSNTATAWNSPRRSAR